MVAVDGADRSLSVRWLASAWRPGVRGSSHVCCAELRTVRLRGPSQLIQQVDCHLPDWVIDTLVIVRRVEGQPPQRTRELLAELADDRADRRARYPGGLRKL